MHDQAPGGSERNHLEKMEKGEGKEGQSGVEKGETEKDTDKGQNSRSGGKKGEGQSGVKKGEIEKGDDEGQKGSSGEKGGEENSVVEKGEIERYEDQGEKGEMEGELGKGTEVGDKRGMTGENKLNETQNEETDSSLDCGPHTKDREKEGEVQHGLLDMGYGKNKGQEIKGEQGEGENDVHTNTNKDGESKKQIPENHEHDVHIHPNKRENEQIGREEENNGENEGPIDEGNKDDVSQSNIIVGTTLDNDKELKEEASEENEKQEVGEKILDGKSDGKIGGMNEEKALHAEEGKKEKEEEEQGSCVP